MIPTATSTHGVGDGSHCAAQIPFVPMKNILHTLLSLTLILALTVLSYAQGRPASQQQFDVIIRNGTVYNGSGRTPVKADVGIKGDRIAAVGNLSRATAATVIDAGGLAVAPGFINMLSHSETSWLIATVP